MLGALTRPTWQASVESAQVLAGLVSYPPHNSFHVYHLKLWTIVNQLSALMLGLGASERFLSVLISGIIAGLSYVAVGLCTFSISRSAFWGIAAPFLLDFSALKDVLSVNYPMDFMGTPHTYGVVGLAWALITLSLISLGRYSIAGIFLGVAPAVHASMGMWSGLIALIVFLWDGRASGTMIRKMWRPAIIGMVISVASFLVQLTWMSPVLPHVDGATQARFISAWVDFFDFHRRAVATSFPGVQLSMAAVVSGLYLIVFLDEERDSGPLFLLKTMIVASAIAFAGAAVSHVPAAAVPTVILTLMPTRLFLLSNLLFVAILLGLLGRFRSIWVRLNALLLVLFLASQGGGIVYGLIFSSLAFVMWNSLSLSDNKMEFAVGRRLIHVVTAVAFLGLAMRGVIGHIETAANYRGAMVDRTNRVVLASASAADGVLVIGQQCCAWTQLRTRKPLLVEATALDQIPYAPEAGPDMNAAVKAVYGVDLLNPPIILKSAGFTEDLTPVTKPLWETRSLEEWRQLGATFGFTTILTNPTWILRLPELARDGEYVLYQIPKG